MGLHALTIHTGVFEPEFTPDVSNAEVAAAAGYDIRAIVERKDRAMATEALSKGMETLVPQLYREGRFDGILSFGGSGGTSMVTPAMRALPIGVPKLMVSTMASGNVEQYVGTSDIVMMPSIVDVAGLNSISKVIFRNAVLAVCGMVRLKEELKPLKSLECLKSLGPLQGEETLDAAVKQAAERDSFSLDELEDLAPFLGRETMDALAQKAAQKRNFSLDELEAVAPFLSKEVFLEIALGRRERKNG